MGPLRRGLALALLPLPARADVCQTQRPDWDGVPVTALGEALGLLLSAAGLVLLCLSLAALRFRNQWIGLATILLWTVFFSVLTMADPTGVRALAQAEGCIGPPSLFIALGAAICVGIVLYTKPRLSGD